MILTRNGTTPERTATPSMRRTLQRLAGIREWSFHSLRHSLCTTLIRRGGSVEAVRVLAGRLRLDVTQRHVRATAADREATIARLRN